MMININYQLYGQKDFYLRLRFYQDGETRYITVTKRFHGDIRRKHWNRKKQMFFPSAPFSEENNNTLYEIRRKYDAEILKWDGSLTGFFIHMEEPGVGVPEKTMKWLMEYIVAEQKRKRHDDMTLKGSYEGYVKLDRRLREFCAYAKYNYDTLLITEVTPTFIEEIFRWIEKERKNKGKVYVSSMIHATMNRADKMGWFDMDTLKRANWIPKPHGSASKYYTLSKEQCRRLITMSREEMPPSPKVELFRDFCVFLMFTAQSPCDAVTLKHSDIRNMGGVDHLVFKRRKIASKQSVPCIVPVNEEMKRIILRWEGKSGKDFIFPIRGMADTKHLEETNDDIRYFNRDLNNWLKKLGVVLGCDFQLHTYTFRHTAITNYISKGVPVTYVANLVGTSVSNCEKIYYNNQGDTASRDKVLSATFF